MDDDNLVKKPFVRYDDKFKNKKFRTINIRSNPEMDKKIEKLKDDLYTDRDGTVIKKAFEAGYNVLHNQLGKAFFKGLLNKKDTKRSKFLLKK